jgi:uncharacterized RDD family membrane protein YckC
MQHVSRVGRDSGALSTFASQAERAPSWKDEVNQRLAAHKNRKGPTLAEPARPTAVQHGASSMAAQAAARVAARYAKAPSYSEMLAEEARAAVRAAEAASRAALHAQAAAESILAGLEAVNEAEDPWEPEASPAAVSEPTWEPSPAPVESVAPVVQYTAAVQPAAPAVSQAPERESYGIRWEPDLPVRPAEPEPVHATRGIDRMAASGENWWESSAVEEETADFAPIEAVEPAQPLHANLIQFPREIVAPRKAHPRLAEASYDAVAEPQGQLSIFEVDPAAVFAQPAMAETMAAAPAPAWSDIELDAQPLEEPAHQVQAAHTATMEAQASLGLRLLSSLVDGTLIGGAFLSAVAVAAMNLKDLPGLREMEVGSVAALLTIGLLYKVLFFALGTATPGMKYAHISLCTFGGQAPTRAQRCGRLGAMLLSLLPFGLGVVWALFDASHLCWHDRISRTYLRKYWA